MQIQFRLPPTPSSPFAGKQQGVSAVGQTEQQPANPLLEMRQQHLENMRKTAALVQQLKKSSPFSSKKNAAQRAGQLKQRLDTLKAVISKLPPGDHKMLIREMKQIAKELSALSKQLGSSGSGSSIANLPAAMAASFGNADISTADIPSINVGADIPVPATEQAAAAAESMSDTGMADAQAQAEQAAVQAESVARDTAAAATNETGHEQARFNPLSGNQDYEDEADDKALRSVLAEARKVLKEVLALLKSKHQPDDKETRKLFNDIEREIKALDDNLADLPSGLSALGSAADSIPMEAGIGSLINTSV